MELSKEHYDLLRAVGDLQAGDEDAYPRTDEIGPRYRELLEARRGPGPWFSLNPWFGTDPIARELLDAGLLEQVLPMARFRHPSAPIVPEPDRWRFLRLTDEGRQALVAR